jgi:CRP/FNR family cyclic AMP-dependent transcriptional regulator
VSHSLLADGGPSTGATRALPGTNHRVGRLTARPSRQRDREGRRAADGSVATSESSEASHRALLQEDPELENAVPAADREHALRTLRVHARRLEAGPVDVTELDLPRSTFALLLTSGAVTADVLVGDRVMTQLLIDGDVLLIDRPSPTAPASSRQLVVIDDAHIAVLDQRFLLGAARWPGLMRAVMTRLADQQQRLAVHGAICQLPRVEQRIMAIFCHLASRTGTVTPDGVLLRQPLAHRQIADLIGARRPTVTLALTFLQNHDLLRRRDDGRWLLAHYTGQLTDVEGLFSTAPSAPGRDR